MKKFARVCLLAMLILAMVLSLTACGGDKTPAATEAPTEEPVATEEPAETATEEPAETATEAPAVG